MAVYRLSPMAADDLDEIYEYSILNFGLDQAQTYLLGLQSQFQILAEHPMYGRPAPHLAPDLRRSEYQSHVIFYQPDEAGVLIVRVLHATMDPGQHI